jgi:hypothetical protein
VENKTVIMQHVFKIQYISLLPEHKKRNSIGVFLFAFVYVNAGCLNVKFHTIKHTYFYKESNSRLETHNHAYEYIKI